MYVLNKSIGSPENFKLNFIYIIIVFNFRLEVVKIFFKICLQLQCSILCYLKW